MLQIITILLIQKVINVSLAFVQLRWKVSSAVAVVVVSMKRNIRVVLHHRHGIHTYVRIASLYSTSQLPMDQAVVHHSCACDA